MDNFIEYMWYLLTTPLKKLKKSLNKWYALCRVFGQRFDEAKESILRARDEGMIATCSGEMLSVHGADRQLTRYAGEQPDNYRSRIAMYEEICMLGGTNEGILLAVRTLGYTEPVLMRAVEVDGNADRWAEFYIAVSMSVDEEHPIGFSVLRKTVRKWKEVGAKDNYLFKYKARLSQPHTGRFAWVSYKKFLYYYDYKKLDGTWKLDGSNALDAEVIANQMRVSFQCKILQELQIRAAMIAFRYALQQFTHDLSTRTIFRVGAYQLSPIYIMRERFIVRVEHPQPRIGNLTWHEENHLITLDGSWKLNGLRNLDAWQRTEDL